LPAFTEILTDMNASLPLPTLLVIGASNFMRHWWYLLPAGAAVFICLAHRLIQTSKGKILADQTVLMTPVFGPLIRKIIISQFARTLGSLLQSGVPILHALQIVKNITDNSIIKKALIDAEDDLREGQGMAFSLEKSGIFPPMVTNMITIGEETGALDTLLEKIALFYERETETTITRLSKMLEPVLLVVIGAVVGFIIVSIMFPIFSILDAVE
jgi:type IV pilus assembly protein PilC